MTTKNETHDNTDNNFSFEKLYHMPHNKATQYSFSFPKQQPFFKFPFFEYYRKYKKKWKNGKITFKYNTPNNINMMDKYDSMTLKQLVDSNVELAYNNEDKYINLIDDIKAST